MDFNWRMDAYTEVFIKGLFKAPLFFEWRTDSILS